ncbi:hypothetical protein CsSME_00004545 [Camellia sinensis var. sinensis]
MRIRTITLYSDADTHSLHVKSADEMVRIGPPPARSSYLNASSIIEAAIRTGAQVIWSPNHLDCQETMLSVLGSSVLMSQLCYCLAF